MKVDRTIRITDRECIKIDRVHCISDRKRTKVDPYT